MATFPGWLNRIFRGRPGDVGGGLPGDQYLPAGYSDAYIVLKGKMTVEGDNNAKKRKKELIFKNNDPFRSCISKINNTFIDNAEDLDIVMPMYNVLE